MDCLGLPCLHSRVLRRFRSARSPRSLMFLTLRLIARRGFVIQLSTSGLISMSSRAAKLAASMPQSRPARNGLVAAPRADEADEVVVVGHSGGRALRAGGDRARARARFPRSASADPPLVLLTLGSIAPGAACIPGPRSCAPYSAGSRSSRRSPGSMRGSRKDVLDFWDFDPVAGIGVEVGRGSAAIRWFGRCASGTCCQGDFYRRIRFHFTSGCTSQFVIGERPARALRLFHAGRAVQCTVNRGKRFMWAVLAAFDADAGWADDRVPVTLRWPRRLAASLEGRRPAQSPQGEQAATAGAVHPSRPAQERGHLRLYVPSLGEATHPRCGCEGYPE